MLLALAALAALLYDVAHDGLGRLSWAFLTSYPSRRAEQAGHSPGARRQHLRDRHHGAHRRAARCRRGDSPGGVRRTGPRLAPDRDQHRQPGGGALDHLRPAGPRAVRAGVRDGPERAGRRAARWRCWRCPSSSSRRARRCAPCPQSLREASYALGATKWQTIWHQVLPAALPGHPDGPDPGPVARDRRDGAAHHHRRAHLRAVPARRHLVAVHRPARSRSSTGYRGRRRRLPRTPPRASSCCWCCCWR